MPAGTHRGARVAFALSNAAGHAAGAHSAHAISRDQPRVVGDSAPRVVAARGGGAPASRVRTTAQDGNTVQRGSIISSIKPVKTSVPLLEDTRGCGYRRQDREGAAARRGTRRRRGAHRGGGVTRARARGLGEAPAPVSNASIAAGFPGREGAGEITASWRFAGARAGAYSRRVRRRRGVSCSRGANVSQSVSQSVFLYFLSWLSKNIPSGGSFRRGVSSAIALV